MKTINIEQTDLDFIVDNALNGLWNHCHERLQERHLGDIEQENLIQCRDKCKKLMKQLDPTLF